MKCLHISNVSVAMSEVGRITYLRDGEHIQCWQRRHADDVIAPYLNALFDVSACCKKWGLVWLSDISACVISAAW